LLLIAGIVLLPRFIVDFDVHGGQLAPQDRVKAINDARVTMLQTVGGLAVLLGVYATWRRLLINEEELRVTRDGQVTERFGRAIEHIGNEKVDVRIGGIYALERIARNSIRDRDAIISTLSAFIRTHATRPADEPEGEAAESLAMRASDIQTAITVLGRMPRAGTEERVRVPNTDLRRSRLWQLNLDQALMGGIDLRGARLWDASLVAADLGHADLRDADLSRARLEDTWLVGADLRGARLDDAILTGVLSDERTRWPDGLDVAARGIRLLTERERVELQRRRR
jgi:hypothetical protein